MTVTASNLLDAIERETVLTRLVCDRDQYAIAILIDGEESARVGCLRIERPCARTSHDGQSVEVFASPGMPDGFEVQCDNHEEAVLIAESLNRQFESAYLAWTDPAE